MPNLVGIGLSQVPTNSMLGGMAYQDPEHASIKNLDLKNLSQINSEIADTAVDVFVYDTRKDSDGGAWRKRTQHTSWYNETLNTATRGSRREFPAVAVIVTETDRVTIYDGDDSDLPMWMVFLSGTDGANERLLRYATNAASEMLNAILCVATADTLAYISFIDEYHRLYHSGSEYYFPERTGIVDRNVIIAEPKYDGGYGLPSSDTNDVAMTMLPNAPIDSATGLPKPTIAVATENGVGVIKDDGTVVDIRGTHGGNYNQTTFVDFDSKTNAIISGFDYGAGNTDQIYKLAVFPIPSTDVIDNNNYTGYQHHYRRIQTQGNVTIPKLAGNYIRDAISVGGDGRYAIKTTGSGSYPTALNIFQEEPGTDGNNTTYPSNSRVAYATTSYNTGWMHGDIKGAFLSDTDTTNAVAAYYDDFANNNNNWGFVDASISSGNLVITQQGSARATDGDALNGVATGTKLTFTLTVSGSGTGDLLLDDDGVGAGVGGNTTYGSVSSTGSYTFTATKTASNRLRFIRSTGSNDYNINFLNISTEYDRSVNNKGLGVYGTVTKSAVATAAELVAYGGFNGSNYLRQPHNADLNVGTGDFYIMCWVKGNQLMLWHRNDSGSLDMRCEFPTSGGDANKPRFSFNNGGVSISFYATIAFDTTTWHHCVWVKRGARRGELYIDGVLNNSATAGSDLNLNGTNSTFSIGNRADSPTEAFNGYVSLFRFGASAPSAAQVKKMYEDEKVLFQENAKATLYGSSDAVTALAYDDSTNLLYAGTSSGRSDFQGLRRINNTTTAVTTAISASNGLVAEQ